MRVLMFRLPVFVVDNNTITGREFNIDFSVVLPEKNLTIKGRWWTLSAPEKHIILLNDLGKFFNNEFLVNESRIKDFEVLFINKRTKKAFDKLKFKRFNVYTGMFSSHEIIEEVMKNTPLPYDKDSIEDSLKILRLRDTVMSYKKVIPSTMLNDFEACKDSFNILQPLTDFKKEPVFITFKHEFPSITAVKEDVKLIKKSFSVRRWPERINFGFHEYGGGAHIYNIRKLGLILDSLRSYYTRG